MTDHRTLGHIAFDAYRESRGGRNHDDTPTPTWVQLGPQIQHAWQVAAEAVKDIVEQGIREDIISVHKARVFAELRERALTKQLPKVREAERNGAGTVMIEDAGRPWLVPTWAHGFRVRKAGPFQFVVEATEWTGH